MTDNTTTSRKEEPDLYQRSIKGGYWVFATQILGFIKSIIIYNYLYNDNLELIIVANMLLAVLNTLSESGFGAALIQKKDNVEDYLGTVWIVGILRGLLLFMVIYLAAPWFASFKVEPENVPLAISVIRAMGFCVLIHGFQNIGTIYFQKELRFHKTFWLSMAGTLADIFLSITLVLIYQSVWAYVIARLVTAVVNVTMSYLLCPYRPRFHFIPAKARELWKFGKWMTWGNIMGYLLTEGDNWFVLAYLGTGQLTLYKYAYNFSHLPATHITGTISQVSFPAYAKIQDDLPRLREAYLKVLQVTALISTPVAFLIFILGPDFVRLFLVKGSEGMIVPLQIIALQGLLKSEGGTRGPLFKAIGQPHLNWLYQCLRVLVLAILIYPFTKFWGITGTALATVLATLITKPLGFFKSCRTLNCSPAALAKPSVYPLIAAAVMVLTLIYTKTISFFAVKQIDFFVQIIIGTFVYLGILYLLDVYSEQGYRRLIREYLDVVLKKIGR